MMSKGFFKGQPIPSVSELFHDAIEGKTFFSLEDACEFYLADIGIKLRIFPAEPEILHPSIVKSYDGKYSSGISQKSSNAIYHCAGVVFVICTEQIIPGFLKEYFRIPEIVDKEPYRKEILRIQLTLGELKVET